MTKPQIVLIALVDLPPRKDSILYTISLITTAMFRLLEWQKPLRHKMGFFNTRAHTWPKLSTLGN